MIREIIIFGVWTKQKYLFQYSNIYEKNGIVYGTKIWAGL